MSGAISYDEAVAGQLIEVLFQLAVVDTQRSRNLYARVFPGVLTSRVNKEDRIAPVESFLDLGKANPFKLQLPPLPTTPSSRLLSGAALY